MAEIIKEYFQLWPGLTEEVAHKNLTKSQATTLGHLYQTRRNKISNQLTPGKIMDKECDTATPKAIHIDNTETKHLIFAAIEKRYSSTLTKQVYSL